VENCHFHAEMWSPRRDAHLGGGHDEVVHGGHPQGSDGLGVPLEVTLELVGVDVQVPQSMGVRSPLRLLHFSETILLPTSIIFLNPFNFLLPLLLNLEPLEAPAKLPLFFGLCNSHFHCF